MARTAKLNATQCARIQELRSEQHVPVPRLARRYKVSESSLYKVLDGTYQARPVSMQRNVRNAARARTKPAPAALPKDLFADIPTKGFGGGVSDDVVLEAARLIVARSNFAQVVANHLKRH